MYGKKRGHRRTGSQRLASLGEALVSGFFLALGLWLTIVLLRMPVLPEWRANHDFVQSTGVVTDKKVFSVEEGDHLRYRAGVQVRYSVGSEAREQWTYDIKFGSSYSLANDRPSRLALLEPFEKGHSYPVWYDPQSPDIVVLVRGYSGWLWSLLLVPAAFVLIGGAGIYHTLRNWGKSAEHLAAARQLAARLELLEDAVPANKDFPNVPRDANLTNSPGTRLNYRLPINTTAGWKLAAAVAVSLLWNGIIIGFVALAVRHWLLGTIDWGLLAFIVPFLAIDLWLVRHLVRRVLHATGIGPTQLEISDHPWFPGRHYDLFLTQAGLATLEFLDVDLVCEEQATYVQGTDTRTERCHTYQRRAFRREAFDIPQGLPFEQQCRIEVPVSAMHSFRADHNEVRWKFVVRGQAAGWPPFEREFPIIVYPHPTAPRSRLPSPSAVAKPQADLAADR